VLIPIAILRRIEAGEVDLQFRRWARPTVKAGGTLTTRIGVLRIDAVDRMPVAKITADEARRAGHKTLKDLKRFLARKDQGHVYRVALHLQGPDPRVALRNTAQLTDEDRADLDAKLDRLPWARPYLQTIAEHPATLALDLAQMHGMEKRPFKQRVRRLKELGLTESLEVGYRLSPRGEAYLRK
jgi:hypothetical protein